MIKSVIIKNYLSHKHTEFEFDPGVNVIIGSTDGGKSAALRAIRWNIKNKPQGSSFRSWWGGTVSVEVITNEGSATRIKDKKDSYILSLPGKKPLKLEAFKTNVPDEIVNFFNITDINLQWQLDRHFLLSNTPGEVATYFNKIAKLDKIDKGQQYTQKIIRKLTADIRSTKKRTKQFKKKLEEFEYLDNLEIEVEALERLESKRIRLIKAVRKMEDSLETYQENQKEIEGNNIYIQLEGMVNKVLTRVDKKTKEEQNHSQLETLINSFKQVQKNINKLNKRIRIEPIITNIVQLYKDKQLKESQRNRLNSIVEPLGNIAVQLKTAEAEEAKLSKEFEKMYPRKCPKCGTKLY